jgi:hypothetical protein
MAKLTAAQIKVQTKKILEAIEKEKRRVEGQKNLNFAALEPKDIERKLKRAKSPMIVFESWTNQAQPGGTIDYDVTIWNPDPSPAVQLNAHVWVGSGNVDPVLGTFLLNVDTRFPRLTEPNWAGVSVNPSSQQTISFVLQVPMGVETTNYLGNTCLMQVSRQLDVGVYLERAAWIFTVY